MASAVKHPRPQVHSLTRRNMCSSAQIGTQSDPSLAHLFRCCVCCFLGGFSFSFFFATATVERLAHHMTEPQRQPQPTHSCFASRAFCPVSIKSGQRQLELSTKQRITVPVCYTYHGQLLLDKETKHVALATLH